MAWVGGLKMPGSLEPMADRAEVVKAIGEFKSKV